MSTENEATPTESVEVGNDAAAGGPSVEGTDPADDGPSDEDIAASVEGLIATLASIPEDHTDAGMAEWLAAEAMTGKFARNEVDGWLWYDDQKGIWVRMDDRRMVGTVSRLLVDVGDAIWLGASGASREARESARKAANALMSAKKAHAVLSLLHERLHVSADEFETHPYLLCAGNGVVDLRDQSLKPWSPSLYLLKRTPVRYDPEAWCASSDLSKVLDALPVDVANGLQVRMGQAAFGEPTPDDAITFLLGGGENGKSTLLIGARRALGGYADVLPHKLLLGDKNEHETLYMTLRGLRLGVIEELPDEGHYMSAVNLKRMTQEEIKARYMRQDHISFRATHSLFVSSNYDPRVKEIDHGTWRRLHGWPFLKTFIKAVKAQRDGLAENEMVGDPRLRPRVDNDPAVHAAFLSWIVAGAAEYWRNGQVLPPLPQGVADYTAEWRKKNDVVYEFLDEYAVLCPTCTTTTKDLLDAFNEFAKGRGLQPWSEKTLKTKFESHGAVVAARVSRERWQRPEPPRGLTRFVRSLEGFRGKPWVWQGVCLVEGNEGLLLTLRIEAIPEGDRALL